MQLLGAFPDIHFALTDIVIGALGVCDEAKVTGTHRGEGERDRAGRKKNGRADRLAR